MVLRFDADVLELVLVQAGKYHADGGFTYRLDATGLIDIRGSSRNPETAANAELVVLTFKPMKTAPAAEVSIQSLSLLDRAGRTLALDGISTFRMALAP